MSETYKDREVRCYFGILNIKGLMDTDNKMVEDIEDYGEVRLPLFSHQSYKIKTTFNKNLQYQNTFINSMCAVEGELGLILIYVSYAIILRII